MLARPLLRSVQYTPEDTVIAAYLTRLSNVVVNNDTAFPFDTARYLDASFFTWAGSPGDPLVAVRDHWFHIVGNITTLGTTYTNGSGTSAPSNDDWMFMVARNGLTLADLIVAGRHNPVSGGNADFFTIDDYVWIETGDEIYLILQNQSASTILVESNPSDGPNYFTDAGPGNLSPHLVLVAVGGNAPS